MADKDPYALSTQGYGDSKQILMAIEVLSKLEAAGTITPAEKRQLDSLRALTAPAQDTVNRTNAGYRGMGQGASFGGGDELSALLSSLSGGDYDKALEVSRDRNKLAELNYPEEYGQGKVAGSLSTTALPIGVAGNIARGTKLGVIGTTALGAGEGAAIASAPQFLEGEGGFFNRMGNVDPKMAALGAGIGGGGAYLSGVGQLNDLQDYIDTLAKYKPADTASVALAKGKQFYRPNHAEMADIFDPARTPTVEEDQYMYAEYMADKMRAAGKSRAEILEQTGMLDTNPKGAGGEDLGTTTWSMVDLPTLEALRPSRVGNYGYDIQYTDDLPPGVLGQHDSTAHAIKIDKNAPAATQEEVLGHEMVHADFSEAGLPQILTGSNDSYMRTERMRIILELKDRIRKAPDKATKAELRGYLAELKATTPTELYYNHPGEQAARLATGDDTSVARYTARNLLNYNLNPKPAAARIEQAIKTGLTSETKPWMSHVNRALEDFRDTPVVGKYFNPVQGDYFATVPMDLDHAVVAGTDYLQWTRAGKPLGNFQAWMYQGKP